jgi:drug/metabolite transporter, DME family
VNAHGRGALAIAGAALLWSTGGLGIKSVAAPALTVACYRSAVAALVLLAVRGRRPVPSLRLAVAVVSYAGCLATFVVATKWTTAANAIFLQYSGVVWVLLLAPVLLDEPFLRRDAVAVAVAFAGMSLFFVGRLDAPGRAGDLVALASGVCWAALVLSLRGLGPRDGEATITWGNVVAALGLLPFLQQRVVDGTSAAILIALGAFQIGLPALLFVIGVRHVPAAQAALVGMLEPVANPLWVWLLLGERPAATALAGGVVVLAAIAWRTAGTGRAAAPAVAPPA